ncbi:MAG: hypothetical protein Q9160_004978 [Pyrenula sp. 1 TL-2023]
MAAAAARYQHRPIDSSSCEIRLLTIHAGSSTDQLDLSLDTVQKIHQSASTKTPKSSEAPISINPRHPFDALSYAWGPTTDLVDIQINDQNNTRNLLSVTRNLSVALPYLRHADKDRMIWIDAISINQKDLDERALQVQLIADIFQQARAVVCWMGPESEDSDLAVRTIRDLSLKVNVDLRRQKINPTSKEDEEWADLSKPLPYDSEVVHALSNFFGRAYFSRLWVFQEIRQAADRAILQCGQSTFERQTLIVTNWCFVNKPWKEPISDGFKKHIELVRQMLYTNVTNLGLLIRRTANLKCTDPRDRVYALMGMRWKEERELQVTVDYTKPAGKVYQDYVQQFIARFKSLRLLSFCEIQDHSSEMPTWVPDWSRPPHANAPRALQSASGNMPSDVTGISEDILAVTGLHIATTQDVAPMDIGNGSDNDAIQLIQRHAPPGVADSENYTILKRYCCTLCVETFSDRTVPPKMQFPSFPESLEALKTFLRDPAATAQPGSQTSRYCQHVIEACTGRSFVTTREGHIGLAPAAAQAGDYVRILLGCRSLMILRPKGLHQYEVIGLAYLHGLSNSEPLFGPLPDSYRAVSQCDKDGFVKGWTFLNVQRDELEAQDPRLRIFARNEIVEGLWMGKAPTIDALKKRGVNLQTFELI